MRFCLPVLSRQWWFLRLLCPLLWDTWRSFFLVTVRRYFISIQAHWCSFGQFSACWKQVLHNLSGHTSHPLWRVNSRAQTLPRPLEGTWLRCKALCNTSSFSVHHYHQNHKEKTSKSRQKEAKSTLSRASCWYFPKSEKLSRLEFARIFFPSHSKPHEKMLHFLFLLFFFFVFRKLFWRELVILAAALHPQLVDEAILLFFWARCGKNPWGQVGAALKTC